MAPSGSSSSPSPSERLETRLEFETLIADLSSRFINLPARQVSGEIQDALPVDQERGPLAGRVVGEYDDVALNFFALNVSWRF